jgi:hypothetical protein
VSGAVRKGYGDEQEKRERERERALTSWAHMAAPIRFEMLNTIPTSGIRSINEATKPKTVAGVGHWLVILDREREGKKLRKERDSPR